MSRDGKLETARRIALAILIAGAIVGFGRLAHKHQPIPSWFSIRYFGYWLLSILFGAACLSSGHALVKRALGGRVLPLYEQIAVSFATGVYVFFLGKFVGGVLGRYGPIFFVALPVALLAAGARPTYRYARRAYRAIAAARRRRAPDPWWGLFVHGFGIFVLILIYFAMITPNNAAFDSRWQHLGIAEHYAAEGAVRRFPEGWFVGAQPHLASFLFTWAYLLPKGLMFDHVELAAHLELTVFLVALVGVPALFRRMVRPRVVGPRAHRYAWVARFVFPGILLYDSSLCLGADHIASVFAAPIYLLLLRAWKDLSPRATALLALAMTGAMLTKYTGALLLVAPPLVVVPARALWLGALALRKRGPARAALLGPLAAGVTGVVAFAPHWLKNLIWYGDPLYPVLYQRFHARPWTADGAARFEKFMSELWRPERNLKGLGQSFASLVTFSFVPNDWDKFHGTTPVFGSLFTFALFALPILKGTKRLWGLFAATHLGIFIWFWTHHQDRYLQAAMPLMAAATASVLALVWNAGVVTRVLAGGLVGLQIVWGSDVYFMPAHIYTSISAKASIDMLSRPAHPVKKDRFVFPDPLAGVGRYLPKGSKPLLHDWHTRAGLGHAAVADCPYHQGGISYARTPTTREVYAQLASYGVTHVIDRAGQPREPDTLAGEMAFHNFVYRTMGTPKTVDGWLVSKMAAVAPPAGNTPDPVFVHSCGRGLKPGLYHLADLTVPTIVKGKRDPRPYKASPRDAMLLVREARAVAVENSCRTPLPKGTEGLFVKVAQRDPYQIWLRR